MAALRPGSGGDCAAGGCGRVQAWASTRGVHAACAVRISVRFTVVDARSSRLLHNLGEIGLEEVAVRRGQLSHREGIGVTRQSALVDINEEHLRARGTRREGERAL
jgi:hypothetical protein